MKKKTGANPVRGADKKNRATWQLFLSGKGKLRILAI
ncbi:hypothetical protein J2X56_002675 [Herbaspirillum sp. 1173]|nr:hypothetical protein [Herbaspirillum sp. 1173]